MAPGLHIAHKVNWSDLEEIATSYVDPGIEMPVGTCGLIHLTKKRDQLQVKRRSYLNNKVCQAQECSVIGTKRFRKTLKEKDKCLPLYIFPFSYTMDPSIFSKRVSHFIDSFTEAVEEFANSERKKIIRKINTDSDRENFIKNVVDMLKSKHTELMTPAFDENWRYTHSLCALFPVLIEAGEVETLLQFNDEEIISVFHCTHGGQAVGNNWNFLSYRVMSVYFKTNLIVALGLEEKPESWGQMKPGTYFRSQLMYDCDGQTFLDSGRKYLKDDVYMKDFNSMKELCKLCFRFCYVSEMLAKEVGTQPFSCVNSV